MINRGKIGRDVNIYHGAANEKWAPDLFMPAEGRNDPVDRFVYTARRSTLVGRDDDLQWLRAFVDSPQLFAWQLLCGPGGMGKSRLALELCCVLIPLLPPPPPPQPKWWERLLGRRPPAPPPGWRAGFLGNLPAENESKKWKDWEPDAPTLLVLDYVAGREAAAAAAVRALSRREMPHPVRLLLLEREAEGEWSKRFYGVGTEAAEIRRRQHQPPKTLAAIGDESLWRVIVEYAGKDKAGEKAATLTNLARLDPQKRPLFALFLADALKENGGAARFDHAGELLDRLLQREAQKFWIPAGVADRDRNLLLLATILGGAPAAILPHHALQGLAGQLPDPADTGTLARYQAMVGQSATQQNLPPLQPDILGEWFVLTRFAGALGDALAPWLATAWTINPLATAVFLDRLTQDFPDHPQLPAALHPPDGGAPRWLWGQLVVNAVARLGPVDPAAARGLYQQLQDLARQYPVEPALRENQAKAAFNLIVDLGPVDLAAARGLYQQLQDLARQYPAEPALRERQADAVVNLINHLGPVDLAAARGLYQQLQDLARQYPAEPALREAQAKAAFNLINDLLLVDRAAAQGLYQQLQDLARQYPAEPALRAEQAKAAFNLIVDLGPVDPAAARGFYPPLQDLATQYPAEPALREAQAKAAVNLIADLGPVDPAAAQALYRQLQDLATQYPAEPALRTEQARAAFNLINGLLPVDLAAARGLYQQLQDLARQYPAEPVLRENQADAAVNLIADLGPVDPAAAQGLYQQLQDLATQYPAEPALRTEQAKAAVNLAISAVSAGRWEEAGQWAAEIAALLAAGGEELFRNDPAARAQVEQVLTFIRQRLAAGGAASVSG